MEAMAQGFSSALNTLYFSDEAMMEFGREFSQGAGSGYISVWKRDITQTRAYGRGVIASVQSISQVDDILKANCATVAVFKTPHPQDASEALQLVGAPTAWVPKLQNLSPGQALVRSEGFGPVFVRFPFVDLGDYPSEAEVDAQMAPRLEALNRDIIRSPLQETAPPIFFEDGHDPEPEAAPAPTPTEEEFVLKPEHAALLRDVQKHPDASVSQHYEALNLSAGKGTRLKAELVKQGLLVIVKRKVGNHAPLKILKLTDAGRAALSQFNTNSPS